MLSTLSTLARCQLWHAGRRLHSQEGCRTELKTASDSTKPERAHSCHLLAALEDGVLGPLSVGNPGNCFGLHYLAGDLSSKRTVI